MIMIEIVGCGTMGSSIIKAIKDLVVQTPKGRRTISDRTLNYSFKRKKRNTTQITRAYLSWMDISIQWIH